MQFQKYAKYKPSGIEWLGEIPEGWEVKRLKDVSFIVLGKMINTTYEDGYYLKPYLKSKNIGWGNVALDSVEEMYFTKDEIKTYRLKKNDILLSEGGEVGKTCLWNEELEECYIQNSVHKVSVKKKNDPKYFFYFSYSLGKLGFYNSVVNLVSIKHLTREKLVIVPVYVPSLQIQTAIADYLDKHTALIDKKIELLRAKKQSYTQLKQTLINEVVSKGLDETVEMKDSGIEWIGQIPKHWGVKRVKEIFEISKTVVGENSRNYQLLSLTQNGVIMRDIDGGFGKFPAEFDTYQIVKENDLIFCLFDMDVTPRTIGISSNNGMITGAYTIVKTKPNIFNKYYYYLYLSADIYKKLTFLYTGLRSTIRKERFLAMDIIIPAKSEQIAIANYLDEKTNKIDQIIKKIDENILALQEFRKTLINDVVIGKVKVL